MSSIKKVKNDFDVVEISDEELFSFSKKNEIIKVYDNDILEKIVEDLFNEKYKKLLYLVMSINEDEDSTETDSELALIKIENLRKYILSHYSNLISSKNMNKYVKMLLLLESKINFEKRRGRGR